MLRLFLLVGLRLCSFELSLDSHSQDFVKFELMSCLNNSLNSDSTCLTLACESCIQEQSISCNHSQGFSQEYRRLLLSRFNMSSILGHFLRYTHHHRSLRLGH